MSLTPPAQTYPSPTSNPYPSFESSIGLGTSNIGAIWDGAHFDATGWWNRDLTGGSTTVGGTTNWYTLASIIGRITGTYYNGRFGAFGKNGDGFELPVVSDVDIANKSLSGGDLHLAKTSTTQAILHGLGIGNLPYSSNGNGSNGARATDLNAQIIGDLSNFELYISTKAHLKLMLQIAQNRNFGTFTRYPTDLTADEISAGIKDFIKLYTEYVLQTIPEAVSADNTDFGTTASLATIQSATVKNLGIKSFLYRLIGKPDGNTPQTTIHGILGDTTNSTTSTDTLYGRMKRLGASGDAATAQTIFGYIGTVADISTTNTLFGQLKKANDILGITTNTAADSTIYGKLTTLGNQPADSMIQHDPEPAAKLTVSHSIWSAIGTPNTTKIYVDPLADPLVVSTEQVNSLFSLLGEATVTTTYNTPDDTSSGIASQSIDTIFGNLKICTEGLSRASIGFGNLANLLTDPNAAQPTITLNDSTGTPQTTDEHVLQMLGSRGKYFLNGTSGEEKAFTMFSILGDPAYARKDNASPYEIQTIMNSLGPRTTQTISGEKQWDNIFDMLSVIRTNVTPSGVSNTSISQQITEVHDAIGVRPSDGNIDTVFEMLSTIRNEAKTELKWDSSPSSNKGTGLGLFGLLAGVGMMFGAGANLASGLKENFTGLASSVATPWAAATNTASMIEAFGKIAPLSGTEISEGEGLLKWSQEASVGGKAVQSRFSKFNEEVMSSLDLSEIAANDANNMSSSLADNMDAGWNNNNSNILRDFNAAPNQEARESLLGQQPMIEDPANPGVQIPANDTLWGRIRNGLITTMRYTWNNKLVFADVAGTIADTIETETIKGQVELIKEVLGTEFEHHRDTIDPIKHPGGTVDNPHPVRTSVIERLIDIQGKFGSTASTTDISDINSTLEDIDDALVAINSRLDSIDTAINNLTTSGMGRGLTYTIPDHGTSFKFFQTNSSLTINIAQLDEVANQNKTLEMVRLIDFSYLPGSIGTALDHIIIGVEQTNGTVVLAPELKSKVVINNQAVSNINIVDIISGEPDSQGRPKFIVNNNITPISVNKDATSITLKFYNSNFNPITFVNRYYANLFLSFV